MEFVQTFRHIDRLIGSAESDLDEYDIELPKSDRYEYLSSARSSLEDSIEELEKVVKAIRTEIRKSESNE